MAVSRKQLFLAILILSYNRLYRRGKIAICFGTLNEKACKVIVRIIARYRAIYFDSNAPRSKTANVERWKLRLERLNCGKARLTDETLLLQKVEALRGGFRSVQLREGHGNVETLELWHFERAYDALVLKFSTISSTTLYKYYLKYNRTFVVWTNRKTEVILCV